MIKQVHRAFYFLIAGVFLFMISPSWLSDGMFMDGIIYATISRNMAEGLGSFWAPQFTETLLRDFFEHPPLALGLESIFFKILGDHYLVERIYSFITSLLLSLVVVMTWRNITRTDEKSYGWLPLLMLFILPLFAWTTSNNMLENTMSLFTSLSILFMIRSISKQRILNLLMAALCLMLAFFTKGPVSLFPLSFFFWMLLFMKDYSWRRFFGDTVYLLFFFAVLVTVLFLVAPGSLDNLQHYYQNQILRSFESVVTVSSRFHIVERLFMELIPAIIITVLLLITVRPAKGTTINVGWKYVFLGLGVSATLPIMISLKQRGFYIIPALPVFALGFSAIVLPRIKSLANKLTLRPRQLRVMVISGYFLVTAAVAFNITQIGKQGRDTDMIHDVAVLSEIIPPHTVLSSNSDLTNNYTLCAYLYRHGYISLERDHQVQHTYLLLPEDADLADTPEYEMINLPFRSLRLYRSVGSDDHSSE